MRLFIGIKLNNSTKEILYNYQCKYLYNRFLQLIPKQNLHITLCFIEDRSEKEVTSIINTINTTTNNTLPFTLIFEKYSLIPLKFNPRMLWANFYLTNGFYELSKKLHTQLNIAFNENRIKPHITLARFKTPVNCELADYTLNKFTIEVNNISLWQSILKKSGAEYHEINNFPLKSLK